MQTCDKILEKIVWVKEKQRFMVRRRTRTYRFDETNEHRLGKNPLTVKEEFLELSELKENEPLKKVIIGIIIKKQATDRESLETLTAFFTQDLEVSVNTDSIYTWQYLTKCEGKVFVHNLESGQTCPVALSGEQVGIMKRFLGKEKRLTEAETRDLLEQGYPIYEKNGEEYRLLV